MVKYVFVSKNNKKGLMGLIRVAEVCSLQLGPLDSTGKGLLACLLFLPSRNLVSPRTRY